MRRSPLLALCLAIAACAPTPATRTAATSPRPATASQAPQASGKPVAAGALQHLQKPAGEVATLTGTIAVDSGYAVAAGGKIISNDGASALAAQGSLITNDGGSLLGSDGAAIATNDGANLVARGQGSLITNDGGSLITNDGGGLITNDGGSLITNDGGSIVAQGGGNIVAQGGGNYGLLATSGGGSVPAAGFWVGLFSLAKGKLLPVGQDEQGKQVYAVFSNMKGGFTLYVPAEEVGNVLVVASDARAKDRRLAVSAVTVKTATNGPVDEFTTQTVAYLRASLAPRLQEVLDSDFDLNAPAREPAVAFLQAKDATALPALRALLASGYQNLSYVRKARVWQALADAMIANQALDTIMIDSLIGAKSGASGGALAEVRRVLRAVQQKADERLAADPKHFDNQPYMRLANTMRRGGPEYRVLKSADVTDMLVHAFLSTHEEDVNFVAESVLLDLGVPTGDRAKLQAAGASFFLALATPLFEDPKVLDAMKAAVTDAVKTQLAAQQPGEPMAIPAAAAAPAPTVAVTTVAGGEKGFKDGKGAAAAFKEPGALALAADGTLYVSDNGNNALRKVAPDGTVSTLVGNVGLNPKGFKDGVGTAALMHGPEALAYDGKDTLYVADARNHCIRKVTNLAGPAQVSTYAGKGEASGSQDGAAADARFNNPVGLALAPDGTLYVADNGNGRLRAIGPTGQVTTVAGANPPATGDNPWAEIQALALAPDGTLFFTNALNAVMRYSQGVAYTYAGLSPGYLDSTFPTAQFRSPWGLATDAKGNVYVSEHDNNAIRKVYPAGHVVTLAGGKDAGFQDGGKDAKFTQPLGMVVDAAGTVYVADRANQRIRKIVVSGDQDAAHL
ncbi:MAG: hypothetical protein JWM80_5540 [Cyanobacteria bacterium RYN_339]|nr:hypothetical protein [Cyanobacteria bacterium RYN_339]